MDKIRTFFLKNTNTKQTVAKNTAWLFIGEAISKISRAAIVIVAARMLGAEGLGIFSYIMAVGGMFLVYEDSGLGIFVTRELSTEHDTKEASVATAVVIKLVLLTTALILFITIGPSYAHSAEARAIIPLMAVILCTDSLRGFLFATSRAKQQMEVESVVTLSTSILVLLLSVLFLAVRSSPYMLTLGYAVGGTLGFLMIAIYARTYIKNIPRLFSKSLILPVIKTIWPFTIFAIANMVILNIDVFLLGTYTNNDTVGIYTAAQRLIQMAYVISSLIASATFPVFARKSSDKQEYGQALEKVLAILCIVLGLLVIGTAIWAQNIIVLLFGAQYYASGYILQIMSLGLIPIFISAIYFNVIFALNQQKRFVSVYVAGLIISIVANMVLIPRYGGMGAAISSIATFSTMTILTVYIFNRSIRNIKPFAYVNGWFVVACVVFAGLSLTLRTMHCPVIIGLPLSALAYGGIIFLTHRMQLKNFIPSQNAIE